MLPSTIALTFFHMFALDLTVAEQRFLLVERRLRDIVVRALRSSALLDFMVGLEDLLEGFAQVRRFCGASGRRMPR